MTDSGGGNGASQRQIAAVDLGSNSFHMIVAAIDDSGAIRIIDRIKEMVRLGAGLDANNDLDEESQQRALECLGRFAQRLQDIDRNDIRIAGTNTLRVAGNAKKFVKRARKVMDHPIDIVSGVEEARLVYHGAVYSLSEQGNKRLVIDIGGGSTEIIIGERNSPVMLESLFAGCVSVTRKFFDDGEITSERLKKADIFVRQKLAPVLDDYLEAGWDQVVGTSGSIRSISKVLAAAGNTEGQVSARGLKELLDRLQEFGKIKKINLEGLSSERQQVFVGGVVVLNALFSALKLKQLTVSDGALREGLMLDIVGRIKHEDIREVSVRQLAERYCIRQQHADHVIDTCQYLYDRLSQYWSLGNNNRMKLLLWAAQLCGIGLAISHSGFHKHGAYLARNSDMPGFTIQEQQTLSALIRFHRGKLDCEDFRLLPGVLGKKTVRLLVILRLAAILNRSLPDFRPSFSVEAVDKAITLGFGRQWLEDNPLTAEDLSNEQDYLAFLGYTLTVSERQD